MDLAHYFHASHAFAHSHLRILSRTHIHTRTHSWSVVSATATLEPAADHVSPPLTGSSDTE